MFETAHSAAVPGARLVVIGASAGGVDACRALLAGIDADFPAPLVLALHLPPAEKHRSQLVEVLQRRTGLHVKWAENGEVLRRGRLYVAPQGHDVTITSYLSLRLPAALGRPQPSVDRLFASAAHSFGRDAIAVVLSGCLQDGRRGAGAIAAAGGLVLVQDPASSERFDMPGEALRCAGALVLPPQRMGGALRAMLAPAARDWFAVRAASAYVRSVEEAPSRHGRVVRHADPSASLRPR